MSALQFEGIEDTPLTDDTADMYYLGLMHELKGLGELRPSQEEAGGLTVATHGQTFITRAAEHGEREKVVPILYLGRFALRDSSL